MWCISQYIRRLGCTWSRFRVGCAFLLLYTFFLFRCIVVCSGWNKTDSSLLHLVDSRWRKDRGLAAINYITFLSNFRAIFFLAFGTVYQNIGCLFPASNLSILDTSPTSHGARTPRGNTPFELARWCFATLTGLWSMLFIASTLFGTLGLAVTISKSTTPGTTLKKNW